MGYYVSITSTNWLLPIVNESAALDALKKLNSSENDHLKRGGRWGGGVAGKTESWFSWMPSDYDKTVKSVAEVLDMLGFETKVDPEGTRIVGYDSKTGQEELFLATIAHFVEPGSAIDWRGEDDAIWRYSFDGTRMQVLEGRLTYSFGEEE